MHIHTGIPLRAAIAFVGLALPGLIDGRARAGDGDGRTERLIRPGGVRLDGRLEGDAASGFIFRPRENGAPIPLEGAGTIEFEGDPTADARGMPPFQVLLGVDERISGRLASLDEHELRLAEGPGAKPLAIPRAGVRALLQRPGEVRVLRDDFEAIDPARWSPRVGDPSLDDSPRFVGERSLRLPAGGAAITCRLADPIGSGRLEIAYHDTGAQVAGQRWFVDLTFQGGGSEQATIRAIPGWVEETLSVESPRGPRLPVQRLLRRPGWHRLIVRFGPEETELTVDGAELAHGPGLPLPLAEIRLATESLANASPPRDLAVHLDDLSVARFAEPVGRLEVEPSLDEVRFLTGDQLFGQILAADGDGVTFEADGPTSRLAWSEVSGLFFRRAGAKSGAVEGQLARVEWAPGPGRDDRDLDRVEGALVAVDDAQVVLDAPYLGRVAVPRDRLVRLVPLNRARRVVLDPFPRHLGDRLSTDLEPPQPEPEPATVSFTLESVPEGPAWLALDVIRVIGEAGDPEYSELVKKGELRTRLFLNDARLDDLNRFITAPNVRPERIRVPIPPGTLKTGSNVVRFEQTGTEEDPDRRDNLGVLGVALESAPSPPGSAKP